ncbi:MAG: hypothetical protein ABL914_07575 [Novosphingobium sp.]|uniref:hypothetical protein n=1 Tax=Novosphingobium sp. TaxID=1874826 RepID=UPI0032B97E31
MTFAAAKYSSAEALISALDWWREAGLDHDFSDEAQNWLARPEPEAMAEPASAPPPAIIFEAPPAPPRQPIGGDRAQWPKDLAAFQNWWLAEPSLDEGQLGGRVPPRGPAEAELLVLIDHPEAQDSEHLLNGPRGRLLNAILAALGVDPATVYFASALPRHMPLPDWTALAGAGLPDLTLHHVNLVAPKRVIGFGSHVSSLLGHDPAKSAQPLPQIWRLGASVPAMTAPELENLLARPMGKARFWQALLDWQSA